MEKFVVYDYMKCYFLLTLIITNFAIAQHQDSTKIENDSLFFEYRFKIENVNNTFEIGRLENTLTSLFQTRPIFHNDISQYVFNSSVEVEEKQLNAILRNYELRLEYYRKASLILKYGIH